jgi:hypothetical protein
MKWSTGDCGHALSFTFGSGWSFGAMNAQCDFGLWTLDFGPWTNSALGSGAPLQIHASKSATCCADSFFFGGICKSVLVWRMAASSRLRSGSPGTTDGSPELPPRRRPSRVSTRRPALSDLLVALWHS